MANQEIDKVVVEHGASTLIETNGGDAQAYKEELLDIKADMDEQYYSDQFSNTDVAVKGSFEAGSFKVRVKLRNNETAVFVAGQEVPSSKKMKIKNVVAFPNVERTTVPEVWKPEDLVMADASVMASKAAGQQFQTIRNELEENSFGALIAAAREEFVGRRQKAYTYDYDIDAKTGEEILADIADKWDILIGGDKDNLVKQNYSQAEISTTVNERTWRKLATILSYMNTGSETQAQMLLSNSIPQGIIGGGYISQTPSSIMGPKYPVIIGTNGLFGSLVKKRTMTIFTERPALRGGTVHTYIVYRDMNKVVFPDTVFVFSEDPTIPTKAMVKAYKDFEKVLAVAETDEDYVEAQRVLNEKLEAEAKKQAEAKEAEAKKVEAKKQAEAKVQDDKIEDKKEDEKEEK